MDWCNGVGLLIIITVITYVSLFYFQVVKKFWGKYIDRAVLQPIAAHYDRVWKFRLVNHLMIYSLT
jgi:pyrimidine nucleoside transport protein